LLGDAGNNNSSLAVLQIIHPDDDFDWVDVERKPKKRGKRWRRHPITLIEFKGVDIEL